MTKIRGLLYVKHDRVGTRSEGPDYWLQTYRGDVRLVDGERAPWQPDYRLEFFVRRMVEVEGTFLEPQTYRVSTIYEHPSIVIPRPDDGDAYLGAPFELRCGQRVRIADESLTLSFTAVAEESRCPTGVQCAQAGRCTLRLVLTPDGGSPAEFSLTASSAEPELGATKVLGYHVRLHEVEPQPTASEPQPQPGRHVATIVVDRVD